MSDDPRILRLQLYTAGIAFATGVLGIVVLLVKPDAFPAVVKVIVENADSGPIGALKTQLEALHKENLDLKDRIAQNCRVEPASGAGAESVDQMLDVDGLRFRASSCALASDGTLVCPFKVISLAGDRAVKVYADYRSVTGSNGPDYSYVIVDGKGNRAAARAKLGESGSSAAAAAQVTSLVAVDGELRFTDVDQGVSRAPRLSLWIENNHQKSRVNFQNVPVVK